MKRRRGPPTHLEIANRLIEVMARKYHDAFDRKIELDELRGFAGVGAAEALRKWDGRGQFEPFAIQRIRWAVLRGVRIWLPQQPDPHGHAGEHALVAAGQAADSIDETPAELAMTPRELSAQAAWGYRLELSIAEEEAQKIADPSQDVERNSDRLRVRRAITHLPPPEDEILKRQCYDNESFQDIADDLGPPAPPPRAGLHGAAAPRVGARQKPTF